MSYFRDFDQFMDRLNLYVSNHLLSKEKTHLILYSHNKEEVLFQTLERNNIKYFALRNIKFNEENQKKGRFTNIIHLMECMNTPVMVDNIINPIVKEILIKRGWKTFEYIKNDEKIFSMIK